MRELLRAPGTGPRKVTTIGVVVLCLATVLWAVVFGARLYRWEAYIWVPVYLTSHDSDPDVPDDQKHLIFMMVDHYEHGGPNAKKRAAAENSHWCRKFRQISDHFRDDYGNNFKYTWFYPYDHKNESIVRELSAMARDGYGEIELHWHLTAASGVTNATFGDSLKKAIDWFQQFGAFITDENPPRTAFAYIAGNWDLDASRPGPKTHGVTNQIDQLFKKGCYADFTFSTVGTPAQPRKVNSIYYVRDDPIRRKSYDWGEDVRVGKPVSDRLMMFEGPMGLNWLGQMEYGAVESDPRFSPGRVDKWIDTDIHVRGRPEWIFVKIYSHGAQSEKVVLEHDMAWMLETLIQRCKARRIHLHFMTAREAYNVVKAAEAGKTGNPEDYRDFIIPPYRNCIREARPVFVQTHAW